ncbi:MAG: dehypoxanthine futalosine cyclase [Bacteroidia bacterium]|nr:dehypoxanthine futalosine cyclase [Bacteroidia bacterium]
MNIDDLLKKTTELEFLTEEESLFLYEEASTAELVFTADELRKKHVPHGKVTWIIDRNVNITNLCISQCKFCNFCRKSGDEDVYVTTIEEYRRKINELFMLGGDQLLLQGGLHPQLGLYFYRDLFSKLKSEFPGLKLHALGPPEIVHIAKMERCSPEKILTELVAAGLDSLPGAGAEILDDRVRKIISPAKCSTDEWIDVMRIAHRMNILTSATMMLGHIETRRERIRHLLRIRDLQAERPAGSTGFIAFIPWPFQDKGTVLKEKLGVTNSVSTGEYIRTIAISRMLLPNITNIQASWLTVGKDIAQICLHAGANDFGSIMIEEHVVSSAGASWKFDADGIQKAISEAGFVPVRRNQKYEHL